jgi:hypothetical protein
MATRQDKPVCDFYREHLRHLNALEDCPICLNDFNILCQVAYHPDEPSDETFDETELKNLLDHFSNRIPHQMTRSSLTFGGVYQVFPISITFPTPSWPSQDDLNPFNERYTKWQKSLPPKIFSMDECSGKGPRFTRTCPSAKFDLLHIEEVVHNGLMGIYDSYFAEEPTHNMEFYFDAPLIGIFSSSVIGSLFCLEVVGCACFVSEISNLSLHKTPDDESEGTFISEKFQEHAEETKRQLQKALQESYIPLKSPIFTRKFEANQFTSQEDSRGLLWTPQSINGYFYKIISLQRFCEPLYRSVTPSTSSLARSETHKKIIKEQEWVLGCTLAN